MIDSIQDTDIRKLAAADAARSVSIFLPTHRQGPETRQDRIRLKNLIDRAGDLLEKSDGGKDELHDRVRSFIDRIGSKAFWDHQGDGLAVYFREESEQFFRLAQSVPEQVYVANEYLIRPLLPQRYLDRPYLVVALTWDGGRLLRAGAESMEELKTEQFPFDAPELVGVRDAEEQLQYASHQRSPGGGGGDKVAMYHGHGEGEHKIEADRQHYLVRATERIEKVRRSFGGPLLLMATEEVVGHLPDRAEEYIDAIVHGSPANASPSDIMKLTRKSANQLLASDESKQLDNLGTALSNSRASTDATEVLNASFDGRVQTLILNPQETLFGCYDFDARKVSDENSVATGGTEDGQRLDHHSSQGKNRDLSNLAAIRTVLADGELVVAEGHTSSPLAAIFRY